MASQLLNDYFREIDTLRRLSGSAREKVVREAFKDLLKRWARSASLDFIAEQHSERDLPVFIPVHVFGLSDFHPEHRNYAVFRMQTKPDAM